MSSSKKGLQPSAILRKAHLRQSSTPKLSLSEPFAVRLAIYTLHVLYFAHPAFVPGILC